MTCPLSLNHIALPCLKEKCGWWNKTECSIVTIAKNGMSIIKPQMQKGMRKVISDSLKTDKIHKIKINMEKQE